MADPSFQIVRVESGVTSHLLAADHISALAPAEVRVVVATQSQISETIERFYSAEGDIDSAWDPRRPIDEIPQVPTSEGRIVGAPWVSVPRLLGPIGPLVMRPKLYRTFGNAGPTFTITLSGLAGSGVTLIRTTGIGTIFDH